MKKIIKVFPRRTKMTPEDGRVGLPEFWDEADEIHISVTFTKDLCTAHQWAREWQQVGTVIMGGPAFDDKGGEFVPGMYVKHGCVITSRGCPNRCWFCSVPKREGDIRELPIVDGWNVLDSNLLACSETHIEKVFAMLARQKHPVEFTGGLEAARMTDKWAKKLTELQPKQIFFAYDTANDLDPLIEVGRTMALLGWKRSSHRLRCYVLVGYRGDTWGHAWGRMFAAWQAGFFPMGMLYQNEIGAIENGWKAKPFADVHCIAKQLKRMEMGLAA